jgi:hypothetical protein
MLDQVSRSIMSAIRKAKKTTTRKIVGGRPIQIHIKPKELIKVKFLC